MDFESQEPCRQRIAEDELRGYLPNSFLAQRTPSSEQGEINSHLIPTG
jgi:hypothetical protein